MSVRGSRGVSVMRVHMVGGARLVPRGPIVAPVPTVLDGSIPAVAEEASEMFHRLRPLRWRFCSEICRLRSLHIHREGARLRVPVAEGRRGRCAADVLAGHPYNAGGGGGALGIGFPGAPLGTGPGGGIPYPYM